MGVGHGSPENTDSRQWHTPTAQTPHPQPALTYSVDYLVANNQCMLEAHAAILRLDMEQPHPCSSAQAA
eukprot:2086854-Amphidinium_carterae.1